MNRQLLVITGVQRSGNTILAKLIGNHSRIKMEIDPSITTVYNAHNLLLNNIKNNELGDVSYVKTTIDKNLNNWYPERLNGFNFSNWHPEIVSNYLKFKLKDEDYLYLGIKTPIYCNRLEEIELLTSDVKYINVYRDPRSVVYSQMSKINISLIKSVTRWKKAFFKSSYYQVVLGSKKYLNISYESLINNPEKELSNICNFLGIKFEKEMLNLKDKKTLSNDSYVIPYFDKNKLEAYKNNLSAIQIKKIESYCYQEMELLSYTFMNKNSSHKKITRFKCICNEFVTEFRNLFIANKMHMTDNKLKKIGIPLETRLKSFFFFLANTILPKSMLEIMTKNNRF